MSNGWALRSGLLIVLLGLGLGLGGCDRSGDKKDAKEDESSKAQSKDEDGDGASEDDDDKPKKKKKKTKKKTEEAAEDEEAAEAPPTEARPSALVAGPPPPPPAPPPPPPPVVVAPPPAADSTGIPECDQAMASMLKCFPQTAENAGQMRDGFKLGASNPTARAALVDSCNQMIKSYENCGGVTSLPPVTPPPVTPPPPAIDTGPSAVPTLQEWDSVTTEVTVRGSTALNCETKMVREWIRVSCRDRNSNGGKPKAVRVTRGERAGETFTFASGSVASLVVRYTSGIDLEARFTWTDGSRGLHISWPRGAPEPIVKGEFF